MVSDIRVLALDIDGVITDGSGILNPSDEYEPRFDFHDLDAVTSARRAGFRVVFVTGEDSKLIDRIANRFGVERVTRGAKDKVLALESLALDLDIPLSSFCYVGDSDRDAPALSRVGLGFAPANATPAAKAAAHRLLMSRGAGSCSRGSYSIGSDEERFSIERRVSRRTSKKHRGEYLGTSTIASGISPDPGANHTGIRESD